MLAVKHNLTAMNAQRQFNLVGGKLAKSTEKLSSGYKINRAADNAAGLAISEKMRRQIRGLTQASTNAQDGISMVQTAEGGLNEVHDMLQRANELSIQAANATNTDTDREYINSEFQNIKKEINRVADTTTFNEIQLFPSDGSTSIAAYNINYDLSSGVVTMTDETQSYNSSVASAVGGTSGIANLIANTMIPNVAASILSTFSALDIGSGSFDVPLTIKSYDGAGSTLAFASYSYYSGSYGLAGLSMTVDSADFNDSNALTPGSDKYNLLLSTINHEVTHTVMQSTLTKAMATELPSWFKEGVAQLAGGGFTTGWNNSLIDIAKELTSANDTSKDTDIANYLKKYSVEGRPYGHGYLACAYMGYIASGASSVTSANIAAGMNKILAGLMSGKSFEDAVKGETGFTPSEIASKIKNADSDVVDFVRTLSYLSIDGAGSILDNTTLNANGYRNAGGAGGNAGGGGNSPASATTIPLQVGAEAGQIIEVSLFSIGTISLGIHDSSIDTIDKANESIDDIKTAISKISSIRSYYGATQNRLEHTIANLDNIIENTTAAESQIRDTDMAKEVVEMNLQNILQQAGISMMTQANQSNQGVLNLLQ